MEKCAVLDVGSNSVILLLCECDIERKKTHKVILDLSEVTRLGEGVQRTKRIKRSAMDRTLTAIKEFMTQIKDRNVDGVVAVGTSVLRLAENADEFLRLAKSMFDLEIEVISAHREANLSYLSVVDDVAFSQFVDKNLIVFDIGGGSTELIYRRNGDITCKSVDIGAVSGTDRFVRNDPPTSDEIDELSNFVEEKFSIAKEIGLSENETVLVGIGGTIVNLAMIKAGIKSLDQTLIHSMMLTKEELAGQIQLFGSGTTSDRLHIPGLETKRADIILGGAVILQKLVEMIGVDRSYVSTHGIRHGIIIDHCMKGNC